MGLISLYLLAVIFASIDQSYCAVSWSLEKNGEKVLTDYTQYRETNFYRGIFLSYSSQQKNEICQDFYFVQLLETEYIDSDETSELEKQVSDGLQWEDSSESYSDTKESEELIAEAGPTPEEQSGRVTRKNIGVPSDQESGRIEEVAEDTTGRPSQQETERTRVPIRAYGFTSSGVIGVTPRGSLDVSSSYSGRPPVGGTAGGYHETSGGASGGPPPDRLSELPFKPEAEEIEETSSLEPKQEEPLHSVKVIELTMEGQKLPNLELVFQCSIKEHEERKRNPDSNLYFMASAHRPNWLYMGLLARHSIQIILDRYMWLSPTYINLEQEKVEQMYVNMRQNLDKLKSESAEYVEMIESRNDIYLLSNRQKFFTCLSVLTSPIYRRRNPRTTISLEWFKNQHQNEYSEKVTVFPINKKNQSYEAECISCESYNVDYETYQKVYVTVSNDDRDSVFVLEQGNDKLGNPYFYVSKYFKKVTSLMNAQVPLSDTKLFQIFETYGVQYESYF